MSVIRPRLLRALGLGLAMLAACAGAVPGAARAQTPDENCAAGELFLLSPDAIDMRLQTEGRKGLVISWAELDQSLATCYTLSGTEDLATEVVATGGFGDKVDRYLSFTAISDGEIGGRDASSLVVAWRTQGTAADNSLAGALNLANNGGVWYYDASAGEWLQRNAGLLPTWRQTNVRSLALGPDGRMLASITKGTSRDTDPRGLWTYDGTTWSRLAPGTFDDATLVTRVEFAPGDASRFAVGTSTRGLFVTADGGQTFTQWTTNLDPGTGTPPTSFRVTALKWLDADRLFVAVTGLGVFRSTDGGASFARLAFTVPASLDVADPANYTYILPEVNAFVPDPSAPDRILAALNFHGVYESLDAGTTWTDMYGNLLVRQPNAPGAWVHTALDAVVDRNDPQVIVMGIRQKGLYRTADGGQTWSLVATEPGLQPAVSRLTSFKLLQGRTGPSTIYSFEDAHGILVSADGGVSWSRLADEPVLNTGTALIEGSDPGDIVLASIGGGIYTADAPLLLKDTYTNETSPSLRSLDLGLTLQFGPGAMQTNDAFELVAQTFQGWAVWRAPSHDRESMTLLGLYDRVNPEDCIEGFCGDLSYDPIPSCFRAKRAACFEFAAGDTIRFFDNEVYNGFAYYYAVTTFDYGNTALTPPQNNTNDPAYSPRWAGDPNSPFEGAGNQSYILVNEDVAEAVDDEEIYAFPNPVRLGAGVPRAPGEMVVFTNLPAGSSLRIFTTAGDDVIDFGPEALQGGQIYWSTDNRSQEQVSAGVYLYKVESPQREPYWGRIVVIR